MQSLGWSMFRVSPGKYGASGMPDWYATHPRYGYRWIETKAPGGKLRSTQKEVFKQFAKAGIGVFVMLSEDDYLILFPDGMGNWYKYV